MSKQIDLYTAGTPNGHKINILVEELGLDYKVHGIDISKNAQKEDWFLKINPNGRIPAIVDNATSPPKRIFEGASIMLYVAATGLVSDRHQSFRLHPETLPESPKSLILNLFDRSGAILDALADVTLSYLCERYDPEHKMSFPYDSNEYWEVVEWLVWMQSGIGPMQGQANHFYRYAPEKIDYAIKRYHTECRRLYQVLEDRLASQEEAGHGLWTVGGRYSIADLASFSWINWAEWAGVPTSSFPRIEKWMKAINARPATHKGVNIPEPFAMKEAMKTKEGEEEYAKHHSNWVMQGMKDDQEKHK